MNLDGQQKTHSAYEDPDIVAGYIKTQATAQKLKDTIAAFSKTIDGKNVLDLGCGPGHDSYLFAELGFEATGLDYSTEMIRRAKKLKTVQPQPTFVVGDMRNLTEHFTENQFDAVWASASLLHLRPNDIHATLAGITTISKPGAKVYISLKSGTGTVVTNEGKYGKKMQREFTLWTKAAFLAAVAPFGWKLNNFTSRKGSIFMGQPTKWLGFFFEIKK